jgi:hypothetical protein
VPSPRTNGSDSGSRTSPAKSSHRVHQHKAADKAGEDPVSAIAKADGSESGDKRGCWGRFKLWRATVRLPAWFIYVAYAGVIIYLAGCVFICLVMGLKFDLDDTDAGAGTGNIGTGGKANRANTGLFAGLSTSGAWVIASALSIVQDIVFNQPLRAVIESLLAEVVGSEHLADLLAL